MIDSHIMKIFDAWNDAIQTDDPEKVVALYDKEGVLIPTLSDRVRHNHEEIHDYFEHFVALHPVGEIKESNVRIFGELAVNSGIYSFMFPDKSVVLARFTFVYRWNGQKWLIIEHHSSQMPQN